MARTSFLAHYYGEMSAFSLFMKDVKSVPQLTDEELADLWPQVATSIEARNQLVNSYLPLVVGTAKLYQSMGIDMLDLFQEGAKALIRAVELFDWTRGVNFASYARRWIRAKITYYIYCNLWKSITLPYAVGLLFSRMSRILLMSGETGSLSAEQIAKKLGVKVGDLIPLLSCLEGIISLDLEISEDNRIADTIPERPYLAADDTFSAKTNTLFLSAGLNAVEKELLDFEFGLSAKLRTKVEEFRILSLTETRRDQIRKAMKHKMALAAETIGP